MSGANGKTPEIRPPSIKGMLRFWWRALNGHLQTNKLQEQEGLIFGSTAGRSKIMIRLGNYFEQDRAGTTFLLPHKEGNRRSEVACFSPNQGLSFEVILLMKGESIKLTNDQVFSFKDLCDLFLVACTLGGFGKRSRRGFGSVAVSAKKINDREMENISTPDTLEAICKLMGKQYTIQNDAIIPLNQYGRPPAYPFIKKIEFGRIDSTPIYNIINAAHLVKKADINAARAAAERDNSYYYDRKEGREKLAIRRYELYGDALGNGGRLASPIYISVIPDGHQQRIILTTLNTIPDRKRFSTQHEQLQETFKDKLKT